MSNLASRDKQLQTAIQCYPELVKSLISFITEPAVVKLLEAGGKQEGQLIFSVRKGQIISFVPGLEMKLGFEIDH